MAESDSSLIAQAVGGDRDALTTLLRRHGPPLRQHLHISRTWQGCLDADDVLQVTYTEAFLRIKCFRPADHDAFLRWLTRIAENTLRNAFVES